MTGRRSFPMPARRPVIASLLAACLATVGGVACSSTPERSTEAFCDSYVEVATQAAKLTDPDDVSIPTLRDQVGDIDRAASHAAKQAPEEIEETVEAVIEPLHQLRDGLGDAENRDDATAELRTYREATGGLTAQQQRLDGWAEQHCGVVSVTTTTAPITVAPGLTG